MMGSISGTSIVSLTVLFGEGNKPWSPLGDGLWKDVLNRVAPEKEGAAMPGEWARLRQTRIRKQEKGIDHSSHLTIHVCHKHVSWIASHK